MLPVNVKPMSADDHIIEPPHLWVDRVPSKHRDACPRIVEVEGRQAWLYEDELTYIPMGSCRALPGFRRGGLPARTRAPRTSTRSGPVATTRVERLEDMDIDGVWGQLCFPNYARFAGHRFFLNVKDRELGLACLRTYNDYLLDEWCATDPARLFGAVILPLNDIDLAVAELRASCGKGREGDRVLGEPDGARPSFGAHRPLGAACGRSSTSSSSRCACTSAVSSQLVTTSADAPPTVLVSLNGLNSMMAGVDWLMSGILERHRKIKVILSEGGAGWIPYILERADKAFHDPRHQAERSHRAELEGRQDPPEPAVPRAHVRVPGRRAFRAAIVGRHPRRQPPVGGRLPARRRPLAAQP